MTDSQQPPDAVRRPLRFGDELLKSILTEQIQRQFSIHPAGSLFHYTSPEGFLGILSSGSIRATNAAYLNDQAELTYPVSLAYELFGRLRREKTEKDVIELIDCVRQFLFSHALFKSWYVVSFSTKGNLLSQWRAYCPQGGYSIGFAGEGLMDAFRNHSEFRLRPVVYDRETQERTVHDVFERIVALSSELRSRIPDISQEECMRECDYAIAARLTEEFIFFKTPSFEEEAEWRIAKGSSASNDVLFRAQAGVMKPYFEIRLGGTDGLLPLSEIFVSPTGDQELAEHSARLLLQVQGYREPDRIIQRPGYSLRS